MIVIYRNSKPAFCLVRHFGRIPLLFTTFLRNLTTKPQVVVKHKSDRCLGAENNVPKLTENLQPGKKTNTQNTKCFIRMSEREVLSHQKVHSFWKIAVAQVAQQTSMRKCLRLECLSLMNLFALSWIVFGWKLK